MCQGFVESEQKKEIQEWKRVRSLGWNIVCGYADPKSLPENQMVWWPMERDQLPKPKRLTKTRSKKIAERIRMEMGGAKDE